ncbi:2-phospho-L-lactate transferase [Candidatus Nanopelagicales bacterium]|nr:2-phospho-L-lactate transferase [Candidatus Nanopelagicales bacterium]
MHAVVIAGGHGGARFARGVRDLLAQEGPSQANQVTVVANVADDIRIHGLHISPDLDTIMYTLGDGLDEERGWGRRDESFSAGQELAAYGAVSWFGLGDRDLATHVIRTQMREGGYSLTEVTAALCQRWDPGVTLLPVTDDRLQTHVVVEAAATSPEGQAEAGADKAIHFQEWWIRYRAEVPTKAFVLVGVEQARPTAAVLAALRSADVVFLAPSNPIVSVDPILKVPGMRTALLAATAPIIGISPLIGGKPLRGMADKCLAVAGVEQSAAGIAEYYGRRGDGGLLDGWLVDGQDSDLVPRIQATGIPVKAVPSVMHDKKTSIDLAQQALTFAQTEAARS